MSLALTLYGDTAWRRYHVPSPRSGLDPEHALRSLRLARRGRASLGGWDGRLSEAMGTDFPGYRHGLEPLVYSHFLFEEASNEDLMQFVAEADSKNA